MAEVATVALVVVVVVIVVVVVVDGEDAVGNGISANAARSISGRVSDSLSVSRREEGHNVDYKRTTM